MKHGFLKNFKVNGRPRFYRCYISAKARCNNPHDTKFHFYGGKGVKFLWNSFEEFRDDMYKSYKSFAKKFTEKNTTLDRIDSTKHYCKENCRWATRQEQNRNRISNRCITFNGKTQPLFAWDEELGFPRKTVCHRLFYGWSIEKTLTQPLRKMPKRK